MAQTVIANVLNPIIVALIGYIVWLLQQTRMEQKEARKQAQAENEKAARQLEAISGGIMFVLRAQLDDYHHRFCVMGEPMTRDDYEAVETCYRFYSQLGGNGVGAKEYSDLRALDIE